MGLRHQACLFLTFFAWHWEWTRLQKFSVAGAAPASFSIPGEAEKHG